jgi:hypothetical protein
MFNLNTSSRIYYDYPKMSTPLCTLCGWLFLFCSPTENQMNYEIIDNEINYDDLINQADLPISKKILKSNVNKYLEPIEEGYDEEGYYEEGYFLGEELIH